MTFFDNKGIDCLVVIGSHARGDDDYDSDVDLLGISEYLDKKIFYVNKVNLSVYSYKHIENMMKDGDLFALHLKLEGKALINSVMFNRLIRKFRYKTNYTYDKKISFVMGMNILQYENEILNWEVANKRIAWCVRTFLLSSMAEEKNVSFSKKDIALFSQERKYLSYRDCLDLINAKSFKGKRNTLLDLLNDFISLIDEYRPTRSEFIRLMENESILTNTIDQMKFDFYSY